jgi:hypothetical protein
MSISSDEDCVEQQKKSNVELEENQGQAQVDVLLKDPELGEQISYTLCFFLSK